ncbi:MAG: type II toxin-antitoxin system PemK/MazF family toxin [bacterium]|nr:type II toxin-antitoxin system PemK/MazF family toxin [bacterium]
MIKEGQIVLFRFPQADLQEGKLRPALVIRKLPGDYEDCLICMISSQLSHKIDNFDEILKIDDPDFCQSSLKVESLIRISRLAVVNHRILIGILGTISDMRLQRIKNKLGDWLVGK